MNSQSFSSPKDPGETVTLTFDFTPELAGEAITGSPVVTVVVDKVAPPANADPAPSALLNNPAQISGGMVLQSVKSGVSGVWYRFVVEAPTPSRVLVLAGVLSVMDA